MKQALVLGAAGFVGLHVARKLARGGYRVTGVGHGAPSAELRRDYGIKEWTEADVTLGALVRHGGIPDVLIQCAGSGSVAYSISNPAQDYQRTVDTTLAALEFVRLHAPGCSFVLPSSAAVYGVAEKMPIPISHPLRPISPYGVHKQIAEQLCQSYALHFGVRAVIVRLFSVFGAGLRKQLLWDSCIKLSAGERQFAGTGAEARDWLHVDDAVALIAIAATAASANCPVINGGSGVARPVRHIVERLARALGIADPIEFTGRARPGDPDRYQADIREARALGWSPAGNLDQEIDAFAHWFRQVQPAPMPRAATG